MLNSGEIQSKIKSHIAMLDAALGQVSINSEAYTQLMLAKSNALIALSNTRATRISV